MKSENPIKKNLEEVFKEFLPDDNAPEHLKKEVFQTLDTLNLIGDFADLFTAKFSKAEAVFFGLIPNEGEQAEPDDDIDIN